MQPPKATKLRNKKILIISSVFTLLLILGSVYLYTTFKQIGRQADLSKKEFQRELAQLASISEYLQELDQIILEKQVHLSDAAMLQPELSENLSELYDNLELIEKHLSQINASVSIQNQTSKEFQTSITDNLFSLSEAQQAIMNSILFSKETIMGILSLIQTEQYNQHSSVIEKIDNLTASLSYTETKLNAYRKELVDLGDIIQHNISENQTELLASVENMQTNIETLLNDYTLQLDMGFQKSFLTLAEKLESIHQQLVDTDNSIQSILTDIQTAAEVNQTKILDSFSKLQLNIDTISADVNEAHLQIQNLLSTLSEDTANNHKKALETLSSLETSLLDFSQKYFSKIIASISDMQISFDSSFSTVKTELADTIMSLDTELSTTLNKYNTSTTNQLTSIQSTVDKQYSSLTSILNANDTELRKYMENSVKESRGQPENGALEQAIQE